MHDYRVKIYEHSTFNDVADAKHRASLISPTGYIVLLCKPMKNSQEEEIFGNSGVVAYDINVLSEKPVTLAVFANIDPARIFAESFCYEKSGLTAMSPKTAIISPRIINTHY